jgi:hypothetical protein
MKHERAIKKAGYITLAALLALIIGCFWISRRIENGDAPGFLSDGVASVVATVCALTAYVAVALGAFIIVRAFYIGLIQRDSSQKQEGNG